jgi:ABC-type lipoprotein release transport system permease subunit
MKFPVFFRVSLKYFWRYRRRYLFFFFALGFGFAVVTVVSSLRDGMKENLYRSAQSHYAGDIIVFGIEKDNPIDHLTKNQKELIFASAKKAKIDPVSTIVRTNLFGRRGGIVHFNGNAVPLKYVVGVDWEQEKKYFEELTYIEYPEHLDDTSVLLSVPLAKELRARRGDSVILEILTTTRQKNTGVFITAGIVEDASFFGYYKVYVSRTAINNLAGLPEDDCSLVGFYLKNKRSNESIKKALHDELSAVMKTSPLFSDRQGYHQETKKGEDGITAYIVDLQVYLSEVSQLMNAIDIASLLLFAMMLAIIMVSAVVTCRLILHERAKETGTMRAIGFYESDVRIIFQLEIACIVIISIIAGFAIALIINWIISYTSFGWLPGFEVFMQNGRLSARYLPGTIIINIISVFCLLALVLWVPIFRNSRNPLPQMLSGGVK